MFFEILFLALLFAIILVRVIISIKMATEHAVAHWNQVAYTSNITSGVALKETKGALKGTEGSLSKSGNEVSLRRSARIQALKYQGI